jgi:hypothetical protein
MKGCVCHAFFFPQVLDKSVKKKKNKREKCFNLFSYKFASWPEIKDKWIKKQKKQSKCFNLHHDQPFKKKKKISLCIIYTMFSIKKIKNKKYFWYIFEIFVACIFKLHNKFIKFIKNLT